MFIILSSVSLAKIIQDQIENERHRNLHEIVSTRTCFSKNDHINSDIRVVIIFNQNVKRESSKSFLWQFLEMEHIPCNIFFDHAIKEKRANVTFYSYSDQNSSKTRLHINIFSVKSTVFVNKERVTKELISRKFVNAFDRNSVSEAIFPSNWREMFCNQAWAAATPGL